MLKMPDEALTYYRKVEQANPDNLSTIVDIPDHVLEKGNNMIAIRSKSGSWAVFDNVSLSTAYPLEPGKLTDGMNICIPAKNITKDNTMVATLSALSYPNG